MADDSGKQNENYRKALESAEKLVKAQESLNDRSKQTREIWGGMMSTLFNLSEADFFDKVPKTTKDLAESAEQMERIRESVGHAGKELNEGFEARISSIKDKLKNMSMLSMEIQFSDEDIKKFHEYNSKEVGDLTEMEKKKMDEMNDFYKDIIKEQETLNDLMEKEYGAEWQNIIDNHSEFLVGKFKEAAVQGDIAKFVREQGDDARSLLASLEGHSSELADQVNSYNHLVKDSDELINNLKKSNKEIFTMEKVINKVADRFAKKLVDSVIAFDQALSTAQRNTGIMVKENSAAMRDLTVQTSAFGMSAEDTVNMMGDLGDELRTTDFGVLSQAAGDFAAIQAATGVSSKEITTIAGELMRAGVSSSEIKEQIEATVHASKMLGVNSKRVIQQMEKNIDKMRRFGFTGGIESLREMAVEAERLRINVDDIFDVAKRARNIEGAMEMAAELQLAGGSFAAINPMDLLSAARKGPKEMQNILKQMGKDIGHFNKETGAFEFDPVDVDRLQIVADSTGMSLDSLQKMIQKNAEDAQKFELFPSSMFDVPEADKNMLAEMTKIGEGGQLEIKGEFGDLAKEAGIEDISMITPDQLKKLKDLQAKRQQSLEEQAAANASLKEAFSGLINAFMHIFTVFEPAIKFLSKWLGKFAQTLGELPGWGKNLIAAGGIFLLASTKMGGVLGLFQKTVGMFTGGVKSMAKNLGSKLMGKGGGGGLGGMLSKGEKGAMDKAGKMKGGGGIASFARSLKDGSKEMAKISMKGILKFAGAMAIIGTVLVGFAAAMAAFGGDASLGQLVTMGASLIILGGSMILFSKLSSAIDMKNLVKFSLAMALVGAGLMLFGIAATMLTDVDLLKVLASIGILTLVIIGLALLGALMSGPQILALLIGIGILILVSAGLLVFAAALLVAGIAFEKLAGIDWTGFSAMGPALLSVIPGLLGFSLAALAFLNPLTLFGFLIMTAVLGTFAAVMIPLSFAMEKGADGFERLAEGINTLKEATADLDFDKLEELAELSSGLAGASVMANIASSLGNLTKSMSGGGRGGGGSTVVKHEVTLKLNGRDLQKFIIDDTDLQS